jgi:uncharacterized protein (TIGR03067 family)
MRSQPMRVFLMLVVLAVLVPDRQDPTPKEYKPSPGNQILGDWKDDRNNYVLRFLPGETAFIINGEISQGDGLTANVVIDWTQTPVHIDFRPKQRGGKMMGILKMEGDHLTVCIRTGGDGRPTGFANGDLLINYNRMRK